MQTLLQGFLLGFVIVLPGMSGGTLFVIFGIYETLITDVVKRNFRPYIPMVIGASVGILAGGTVFAWLFEIYRDVTAAFLLGCLLASIKAVISKDARLTVSRLSIAMVGLAVGFYLGQDPMCLLEASTDVNWVLLFVAGGLSSAAMIIPGIPGSAVLILLGLYDTVLLYIRQLALLRLTIFAIGSIAGIFLLANMLQRLYANHRGLISFCFAGLIMGSSRALLPYEYTLSVAVVFITGFSLVWAWTR